jgi:hypothetical protein
MAITLLSSLRSSMVGARGVFSRIHRVQKSFCSRNAEPALARQLQREIARNPNVWLVT